MGYRSVAKPFYDFQGEFWLPIDGYREYYEVSNLGRVRSLYQSDRAGLRPRKYPYLISQKKRKDNRRHVTIGFKETGGSKIFLVHILVGIAFVPNPDNLPEINHLDGIPYNNMASNLEWTTRALNMQHAGKNNLLNSSRAGRRGILSEDQVADIFMDDCRTNSELAMIHNISRSVIINIKSGKSWKRVTNKLTAA